MNWSSKKAVACLTAFALTATVFAGALPSQKNMQSDTDLHTQGMVALEQMQAPAADSGMNVYNATAVVVNASAVNVRTGPSTSYTKIGTVPRNLRVTIVGRFSNNWYKIVYGSGYGYMSGAYLSGFSQSGSVDSNMTSFSGTANTTTVLNVRSGPGTSYSKIGSLNTGAKVTLVGKFSASNWYKIKYGSGYGYVSGAYLKNITVSGTGSGTGTGSGSETGVNYVATGVTTDYLNVRKGPGTSYGKLSVLAKGASIKIVDSVSGWYKILYGSGYAYVSATYVKDYKPVSTTTTTTTTTTTANSTTAIVTQPSTSATTTKPTTTLPTTTKPPVNSDGTVNFNATAKTTDDLNVRTGPSTGYTKLGVLPKGSAVTVLGCLPDKSWYKINYGGRNGYVCGLYLTNIKENQTSVTTTTTTTTQSTVDPSVDKNMATISGTGVTTDALNVRKGPGTSYNKQGLLAIGTTVQLVGYFSSNNWYKIAYKGGYGYVCGDYLKNIKDDSGLPPVTGNARIATITSKQAIILTFDDSKTYNDMFKEFSPRNGFLPVGAKDYVVKEFTKYGRKFYRLASGVDILQDHATVTSGDAYGDNALVSKPVVNGGSTLLSFATTWNVPLRVTLTPQSYTTASRSSYYYNVTSFTAQYMDIKFPFTTKVDKTPDVSGSAVVSSAQWIKNNDSSYTLRLKLRKAGVFYGYDTYYQNGEIKISIRETAAPQPANNKYGYSLKGVRVWIDAGHGGSHPGAFGFDSSVKEKDVNLAIALKMRAELQALGATVGMTRTTDVYYDVYDCVEMAQDFNADMYIAIHCDSAATTNASGTSAHYYYPYSYEFSKNIHNELVSAYKNSIYTENTAAAKTNLARLDRDTIQNVFAANRITSCPSVLVEYGFISNALEMQKLCNNSVQQKLAEGTVKGIIKYLNAR